MGASWRDEWEEEGGGRGLDKGNNGGGREEMMDLMGPDLGCYRRGQEGELMLLFIYLLLLSV